MTHKEKSEIKQTFYTVYPTAKACGISGYQVYTTLRFLRDVSTAGVDGRKAGLALRNQLIKHATKEIEK